MTSNNAAESHPVGAAAPGFLGLVVMVPLPDPKDRRLDAHACGPISNAVPDAGSREPGTAA
ncbi:MAG: hypothetical protein LBK95_08350 [Bifidobacteriaceae bacterium]|nr:hypothetical protein [Bifidobacteriaceae bacterium]